MPKNQTTPLARAAESFYLDCGIRHLTKATLTWHRKYVDELVTWLAAHDVTTVKAITTDLLREYVAAVQGRDLAPVTVHHHARAAKTFLKWAVGEGLRKPDDNPAARLKLPQVPRQVLPALTGEDVRRLLDVCDVERDRALLLFMLDTGARCAETVAVNVGDLDTKTGAVIIRQGKGQKGRTVYIGLQAKRAMLRYLRDREHAQPEDALWVRLKTGARLTVWGVIQALERMGERAEVHVHPHKLRRTCALWSLRAGMTSHGWLRSWVMPTCRRSESTLPSWKAICRKHTPNTGRLTSC